MAAIYYYTQGSAGPNAYTQTSILNDQNLNTGYQLLAPLGSLANSEIVVEIDLGSSYSVTGLSVYVKWSNTLSVAFECSADNSIWTSAPVQFISFPGSLSNNGVFQGGWVGAQITAHSARYWSIACADTGATSTTPSHIYISEAYVSNTSGPIEYYPTVTVYVENDSGSASDFGYAIAKFTDLKDSNLLGFNNSVQHLNTVDSAFMQAPTASPTGIASAYDGNLKIQETFELTVKLFDFSTVLNKVGIYIYPQAVEYSINVLDGANTPVALTTVLDQVTTASSQQLTPAGVVDRAYGSNVLVEMLGGNIKVAIDLVSSSSFEAIFIPFLENTDHMYASDSEKFIVTPSSVDRLKVSDDNRNSRETAAYTGASHVIELFAPPLMKLVQDMAVSSSYGSSSELITAAVDVSINSGFYASVNIGIKDRLGASDTPIIPQGIANTTDIVRIKEAIATTAGPSIFAMVQNIVSGGVGVAKVVPVSTLDEAFTKSLKALSGIVSEVDGADGTVPVIMITKTVIDKVSSVVSNNVSGPVAFDQVVKHTGTPQVVATVESTDSVQDTFYTTTIFSTSPRKMIDNILSGNFQNVSCTSINVEFTPASEPSNAYGTVSITAGSEVLLPYAVGVGIPPPPPTIQVLQFEDGIVVTESFNVSPITNIDNSDVNDNSSYTIISGAGAQEKGIYVIPMSSEKDIMVGPIELVIYEN